MAGKDVAVPWGMPWDQKLRDRYAYREKSIFDRPLTKEEKWALGFMIVSLLAGVGYGAVVNYLDSYQIDFGNLQTGGHTTIGHAPDLGVSGGYPQVVQPEYNPPHSVADVRAFETSLKPITYLGSSEVISSATCGELLASKFTNIKDASSLTVNENALGGNPANWSIAQIIAATEIFGEKYVQDLIGWAGDLKANRYGVTKVIIGDDRKGMMVVTCPGGGYCWAVDENGNFLNRMDGVGDPKMAGFKRIPDGPLGSRAVTVQEQGCTFRYYIGANGKVVSAFNPLFGQNNTPGQFRGTEPSNREATQEVQTASSLAMALGYKECAGCSFQQAVSGSRILMGDGGVRAIENDDGSFTSTKGWEEKLKPVKISSLSNGNLAIGNTAVAGVTEKRFPIVNGKGETIGWNIFGYWIFYIKDGQKKVELVPVVVEDVTGNRIANAGGWHEDAVQNPVEFFRSKILPKKLINPIMLKSKTEADYVSRVIGSKGCDKYPRGVCEQIAFYQKWLTGTADTRDVFFNNKSGDVVPLWNFDNSLNGNHFIDDQK